MDRDEAGAKISPKPTDTTRGNASGAAGCTPKPHHQQVVVGGQSAANYVMGKVKKSAAPAHVSFGMPSGGATSPERRAQSILIDPQMIRLRQNYNWFQPLAEHNSADINKDRCKVREGLVSDASSSKGSRNKEPIALTPEKTRQGQTCKTTHRPPYKAGSSTLNRGVTAAIIGAESKRGA